MNYLKEQLREFKYELIGHSYGCLWYEIGNVDDSIMLWIHNVAKKDPELEDNVFIHSLSNDESVVNGLKCALVDVKGCGVLTQIKEKFGGKIVENYWCLNDKDMPKNCEIEEIKQFIKDY